MRSYPLTDVFLTMLYFFLFFIWIWILITVFMDIFRSPDLNGWLKALWSIFVIILPFLGVFVYLIARGGKMQERKLQDVAQQQQAFDSAVREAAGTSGSDVTSQLTQLADLKAQGVLTDAEFECTKGQGAGHELTQSLTSRQAIEETNRTPRTSRRSGRWPKRMARWDRSATWSWNSQAPR